MSYAAEFWAGPIDGELKLIMNHDVAIPFMDVPFAGDSYTYQSVRSEHKWINSVLVEVFRYECLGVNKVEYRRIDRE